MWIWCGSGAAWLSCPLCVGVFWLYFRGGASRGTTPPPPHHHPTTPAPARFTRFPRGVMGGCGHAPEGREARGQGGAVGLRWRLTLLCLCLCVCALGLAFVFAFVDARPESSIVARLATVAASNAQNPQRTCTRKRGKTEQHCATHNGCRQNPAKVAHATLLLITC